MRKALITVTFIFLSISAFGWGRSGHDAIAYMAEQHINKKAAKTIAKYLNDTSIVYFSTWMDEFRESEAYKHTTRWHVAYYDETGKALLGSNFPGAEEPNDALVQLGRIIDKMKDGGYKNYDDSTVRVAIKMIVHLVGDMHCPVHVIYSDIKSFKVFYRGKEVKYHAVWDELMIDDVHKWSYMEYNHQLWRLSKKEEKEVQKGNIVDWGEEAARDCRVIYSFAQKGDQLGKPFNLKARPIADRQIQRAGYRLTKVLNDIFGK